MSNSLPRSNAPCTIGEYQTYELQLQECLRLIRLPDKNLGRIWRKHLEEGARDLQALIAGKGRSIQEVIEDLGEK